MEISPSAFSYTIAEQIPAKRKKDCNYFRLAACIIHVRNYMPVNGSVESLSEEERVEKNGTLKKGRVAVDNRSDRVCGSNSLVGRLMVQRRVRQGDNKTQRRRRRGEREGRGEMDG